MESTRCTGSRAAQGDDGFAKELKEAHEREAAALRKLELHVAKAAKLEGSLSSATQLLQAPLLHRTPRSLCEAAFGRLRPRSAAFGRRRPPSPAVARRRCWWWMAGGGSGRFRVRTTPLI